MIKVLYKYTQIEYFLACMQQIARTLCTTHRTPRQPKSGQVLALFFGNAAARKN